VVDPWDKYMFQGAFNWKKKNQAMPVEIQERLSDKLGEGGLTTNNACFSLLGVGLVEEASLEKYEYHQKKISDVGFTRTEKLRSPRLKTIFLCGYPHGKKEINA
jgi:hypothetical protein